MDKIGTRGEEPVFLYNKACSEELNEGIIYGRGPDGNLCFYVACTKLHPKIQTIVFYQMQPGGQFIHFQSCSRYDPCRKEARLGHFEDTVAQVPAHKIGAKPIAAEDQGSAFTCGRDECPRMMAMDAFENSRRLPVACYDLADTVAAAVGTGRPEHHFALEEQRPFVGR